MIFVLDKIKCNLTVTKMVLIQRRDYIIIIILVENDYSEQEPEIERKQSNMPDTLSWCLKGK